MVVDPTRRRRRRRRRGIRRQRHRSIHRELALTVDGLSGLKGGPSLGLRSITRPSAFFDYRCT